MKNILVYVILIALLYWQCTPRHYTGYHKVGDPVVLSENLGEVIDLEERNRYDLFKGIDDFRSAQFYRIKCGGLVAEIQTENRKLVSVNRDGHIFEILEEYVEEYQWIQTSKEVFERRWQIVDYDTLGFPITREEVADRASPISGFGCGLGAAVIVAGMASLVAYQILLPDRNEIIGDEELATKVFAGGIVAGLVSGLLVGAITKNISMKDALKSIKDSRVPQVVE